MKIFKKNRLIKENEFFTDLNNFTYIFNIENLEDKFNDIYYLYIKMKSGYICMIEIQIKTSIIEFGSKEFKCYIESNGRINDVYYNNLDTELSIGNNQHALEIYFKYQYYLPKGNELKIYYENILIDCSPNINDQYNVTCKIPLIYVEFSKKINIYSKLSCKNKINIGWIYFNNDRYVKGIYDLMPKILSIEELIKGKKYNPIENIYKFDINMINYYFWFGCLAYCDDKLISDGACCPEILKDKNWIIVSHKEYYMDIEEFINIIMTLLKFDFQERETILLITKLIDKYIVSVYYYNFVILKNVNFKKIICAFPGTTNYVQLTLEIILSSLT